MELYRQQRPEQGCRQLYAANTCICNGNMHVLAGLLASRQYITPACVVLCSPKVKSASSSLASSACSSCMVGMGPAATCAVSIHITPFWFLFFWEGGVFNSQVQRQQPQDVLSVSTSPLVTILCADIKCTTRRLQALGLCNTV